MPDPSNPPLPPLAAIRAFEAAARHGSFTAAGAELGMTQAAVSYQIRLLEERVGAPLFRRRARGVVLTAEGQRLAEPAGEAMAILREAFAEVRRDAGETLVISVLATFATHVLAVGLGRFQIAHPAITTRVEIDHRMVDLLAGEATVAIRSGQGVWPGLRADHLMRATYTPMVSRAFLERHGPLRRPEDLLTVPRLDADDPDWALWFRAAGVEPPPAAARPASSLGIQALDAQAVMAGHGAGILTPVYFRDALAFLARQPEVKGAFPFLWGAKLEQTETWHGLLLGDGSLTGMTDAVSAASRRSVAAAISCGRGSTARSKAKNARASRLPSHPMASSDPGSSALMPSRMVSGAGT